MLSKKVLHNIDWLLIGLAISIAIFGVVIIYSATHAKADAGLQSIYKKQIYWLLYGLLAAAVAIVFDYRFLNKHAYSIYILIVISLLGVLFFGRVVSGARRWLTLGPFNLQPSEFAKLSIIFVLAKYFSDGKKGEIKGILELALPAALVLALFALIAKQPDLGTSLSILAIFLAMLLAAGTPYKTILKLVGCALATAPLAWPFLKDYQKMRILTLVQPDFDPQGAGYHALQAKIAIGSGGIWGKGLMAGTQSRLDFLPEKHTDFIFAVLAEELGFLGAVLLLAAYFIIIIKGLEVAMNSKDRCGSLIAIGVVSYFSFTVAANVGMTLGILPVVGIALPFMSYGGSSLITAMVAMGLLVNIRMRRFNF